MPAESSDLSRVRSLRFRTRSGLRIAADAAGPSDAPPILLLHGGGQTRRSWKNCLQASALAGRAVLALDARGHGESDWAPDGDYQLDRMADDVWDVLAALPGPPILVGASLGGLTALRLLGRPDAPATAGLVLVDVTPRIDPAGAARIMDFMRANPDGFATLEDVADAIGRYNPHRPRPSDLSGLRHNLREREGRFFWHWDPAFLGGGRPEPNALADELEAAAARLACPVLLVRGMQSDLVGAPEAARLATLMPHARFADVKGAGHMVAGDKNDAFNEAILAFINELSPSNPRSAHEPDR